MAVKLQSLLLIYTKNGGQKADFSSEFRQQKRILCRNSGPTSIRNYDFGNITLLAVRKTP
jgi:hypothetical protein